MLRVYITSSTDPIPISADASFWFPKWYRVLQRWLGCLEAAVFNAFCALTILRIALVGLAIGTLGLEVYERADQFWCVLTRENRACLNLEHICQESSDPAGTGSGAKRHFQPGMGRALFSAKNRNFPSVLPEICEQQNTWHDSARESPRRWIVLAGADALGGVWLWIDGLQRCVPQPLCTEQAG